MKTWGYHRSRVSNSPSIQPQPTPLPSRPSFTFERSSHPKAQTWFLHEGISEQAACLCKGAIWWKCRDTRWKGPSHNFRIPPPTHLSRTTLMVLRPRAAAIWMTACPTPLLDAFWMTESPVEPGGDSDQTLETCNWSKASSLRSYHIRQEMECIGSRGPGTWLLRLLRPWSVAPSSPDGPPNSHNTHGTC